MINVGIVGSTGYAGEELVRLLLNHKDVNIKFCCSKKFADKKYSDVYKNFFTLIDKECTEDDLMKMSKEVDAIFSATPQGYMASLLNDEILNNCKINQKDYLIKYIFVVKMFVDLVIHYTINRSTPKTILC